jgi:hypothetical protein
MLLLFVSVLTHQYVNCVPAAHADVLWLAGDDPNEPEPEPEMVGWALGLSCSEDDPNEPEPEVP